MQFSTPKKIKILIVYSKYNQNIVNELLKNTKLCLQSDEKYNKSLNEISVPGAYEIPFAINHLIKKKKYDGVVALGCIIQGETLHHEMIIEHINCTLGNISLKNDLPIAMGILAVKTRQQAETRAGNQRESKGWEAAETLLQMIDLMNQKN